MSADDEPSARDLAREAVFFAVLFLSVGGVFVLMRLIRDPESAERMFR